MALNMKLTLYIDGEHNTVEVKDKIKSVLPDANYMIFHPADNVSKVTEFDRIKNMSVEEMAVFLCDNFECDICPAFDGNYCPNSNLKICSKAMKKHLESEAI